MNTHLPCRLKKRLVTDTVFLCPLPRSFEKSGNSSVDTVLNDELSDVRKKRSGLVLSEKTGFLHFFILFLCILINCVFFLTMPDYFALFIAASFYLNMFYFIIPVDSDKF